MQARLQAALPRPVRRYIDNWIDAHNPPSGDAILLHNRRVYILPTRFGYLFAVMLLSLFFAAINYQNSMAFILTFMLVSLGITSLWHTHKNLLGITLGLQTPSPVFAGESCELKFEVSHANNSRRFAIGIQYAGEAPVYLRLEPAGCVVATLMIPTARRGQFKAAGITVFTRYPTGLFHAWGWLKFDLPILIYPRPAARAKLHHSMNEQSDGQISTSTIEGDDFAGLREHREGESLRHISWKAHARGRGLLTKTFQGQARPAFWIDWQLIREDSLEDKLSFMTALVLAAESQEQKYGLRLPGKTIEQAIGNAQKHACLQALATFRQVDLDQELELASR